MSNSPDDYRTSSGRGTDYVSYNVTEEYSTSGQFDNGVKPEQFTESYHTDARGRSRSRSPIRRSRSRSPRRDDRGRDRRRSLSSKRLVISNVPYELKWQDIKDVFRKEVGDVQFVELWDGPDGRPKGAGVIEFKDLETAKLAMEKMENYKLKERPLHLREERERDRQMHPSSSGGGGGGGGGGGMGMGGLGMGGGSMMGGSSMMGGMGGGLSSASSLSPQILQQLGIDGPPSNTVFVSNLDYKVTWKKLKDVFRLAGNVSRVEMKEDKEGKSRGMATVIFETPFEAVQAISMFNNQELYDRHMRVKMDAAIGQGSRGDNSYSRNLPSGLKSIGMGIGQQNSYSSLGGMGGGMGSSMGSMGMGSGMSSMGGGLSGMGSGMGGGMGSMSGGLSGSLGSGMGMGMGSSLGMGMGSGMSSGVMGGGMSGGLGMGDSYGGGYSRSGMGSMSGLGGMGSSGFGSSDSMSRFDSGRGDRGSRGDRTTRPDDCIVMVKNLPYSTTWKDLKERFREVADVKYAEIKMEGGRSAGWGLVRYANPEDAQRAISMFHRTRFDGRDIEVKLYR
ncbi:hypothetical protein ScPMuIL_017943 [Solemya velum]